MYKPLTFIASVFFFLFNSVAFAQDDLQVYEAKASKKDAKIVTVISIDGKSQKVHVLPDYVHHVLRVSCLKDTIAITDYWGVPADVRVLGNRFVQIIMRLEAVPVLDLVICCFYVYDIISFVNQCIF